MRLQQYLTEDAESILDYKKTIFDLNVAVGELEFQEKAKVPTDVEQRKSFMEKTKGIKERIVRLKQKILKQSKKLGESIKPELQNLLDKIPDPIESDTVDEGIVSSVFGGGAKQKEKMAKITNIFNKLKDGEKIQSWEKENLTDYIIDLHGDDKLISKLRSTHTIDKDTRERLIRFLG